MQTNQELVDGNADFAEWEPLGPCPDCGSREPLWATALVNLADGVPVTVLPVPDPETAEAGCGCGFVGPISMFREDPPGDPSGAPS